MPALYIITGSNGAGKSTVGFSYLPIDIQNNYSIFDGDKLFMTKQRELWESGIRAHKEAKKIAYQFVSDIFDTIVTNALKIMIISLMKVILQMMLHGIYLRNLN
jgi:predicted ABC-type ATPase